jgi:subtilisin family serine protease
METDCIIVLNHLAGSSSSLHFNKYVPTRLSEEAKQKLLSSNSNISHILKDITVTLPSTSNKNRINRIDNKTKLAGNKQEYKENKEKYINGGLGGLPPCNIRDINGPSYSWSTVAKDIKVDTDVYILDTGVDKKHPELNVVESISTLPHHLQSSPLHGHGTHIAGIIGGNFVGVAPGAKIHSIRMLDQNGSGKLSWILSALDFVTTRQKTIACGRVGDKGNTVNNNNGDSRSQVLVNFSVGYSVTMENKDEMEYLDKAINEAVNSGIILVCAAGNDGEDARLINPARHSSVITVASYNDKDYIFSDFSNLGPAIDICAPGENILSTWLNGEYMTLDGTSFAAPHIVGIIALLFFSKDVGRNVTKKEILKYIAEKYPRNQDKRITNVPLNTTSCAPTLPNFIPFDGKCWIKSKCDDEEKYFETRFYQYR